MEINRQALLFVHLLVLDTNRYLANVRFILIEYLTRSLVVLTANQQLNQTRVEKKPNHERRNVGGVPPSFVIALHITEL